MPVYLLIEIEIHNKDIYFEYIERARPLVERYGGHYLIRGGNAAPLFGEWKPERIILIQFPSREDVDRCFSSKEYLEIKPLRDNSTSTRAIILDGFEEN
ncbi:MAG: DUF1330 domain-containing protein [Syntrophomonadaceae bacterium]